MSNSPLIIAYGGGANSTAMLIEMRRRSIEPDLILFADTGGELPETYRHVAEVSAWALQQWSIPIHAVRKVTRKGSSLTLEQNCLNEHMLPSIAYGFKSCSLKYKVQPQDKFVNHWEPAKAAWKNRLKCTKAIGYDAGEERRAKIKSDDRYDYWYPLIEWQIHREDCLSICRSEGFIPAKSACFFCPSMKKREIVKLAEHHPALFDRAVAMERNAELTSIKGLGRSFSWEDFMTGERNHQDLFSDAGTPEIPCGCYDGGYDTEVVR